MLNSDCYLTLKSVSVIQPIYVFILFYFIFATKKTNKILFYTELCGSNFMVSRTILILPRSENAEFKKKNRKTVGIQLLPRKFKLCDIKAENSIFVTIHTYKTHHHLLWN